MSTIEPRKYASEIEQNQLFHALVKNAFDIVAVVDPETRFLYVSPSIERILGYPPEDLIGRPAIDFTRPELHDALAEQQRQIVAQRDYRGVVEAEVRHRNGSWRVMEFAVQNRLDDPDVGGLVVNYRDITDRKRWQGALLESEERYEKAFMSSPDGFTISRLSDGVFLDVNVGFEQITGFSREEMIGHSSLKLNHWKHPEDRERLTNELRAHGRIQGFQAEFIHRNGTTRVGQLSVEIFEYNGERCMLTCIRDTTDQVRALQEVEMTSMRIAEERNQLAEKNKALRDLLEHVHEHKDTFRHALTSTVNDLIQPLVDRLASQSGRLDADDLSLLERRLELIRERHVQDTDHGLDRLTGREREICDLIRSGLSSRDIARNLGLSPETVNKHRQSIRRKLQIDHRGINLTAYLRSE